MLFRLFQSGSNFSGIKCPTIMGLQTSVTLLKHLALQQNHQIVSEKTRAQRSGKVIVNLLINERKGGNCLQADLTMRGRHATLLALRATSTLAGARGVQHASQNSRDSTQHSR